MSTLALAPQSPEVETREARRPAGSVVVGSTRERMPARGCAGAEIGWQPVAGPAPLRLTRRGRRLVTALSVVIFGAAVLVVGMQAVSALTDAPRFAQTVSVQVGAGQTLWSIAEETNPSEDPRVVIEEIAKLNGLRSVADVVPGQTLVVPKR